MTKKIIKMKRINTVAALCAAATLFFSSVAKSEDALQPESSEMDAPLRWEAGPEQGTLNLDLPMSVGIAITRSVDLKAIHASKEIYRLSIFEKLRDYFPTLSIAYMKNEQASIRETDTRTHQLTFESNITIFDGGKRGLAYDIAKLQSILARNDYRIELNRLVMQVQEAYLQALQLKGTIEIHRKTLEHGRMQLNFINQEFALGEATKLDVMEIEAKVMEIELNLEQAMDEYTTALNQFKLLLKIDWHQPIDVVGDVDRDFELFPLSKDGDAPDMNQLVAIALKNRKEVESSDVEFAISKRQYKKESLYYFPKFSLGLKYSLSDDQFSKHSALPAERNWGVMLSVSTALWGNSADANVAYDSMNNGTTRAFSRSGGVRIMDSMSYKRNIVQSRIAMFTAREKTRETREEISLEVSNAVMNLQNSWKMIGIAKKRLELYDSSLAIERLKANMGETIRYEVVKKEIERGEAAIAHLGARVKYLVTSSYLEIACGMNVGQLSLSTLTAENGNENTTEKDNR